MVQQLETPILFLIFNRPDTTSKVFSRIKEVKPKKLFIAADGPRNDKVGEEELCEKTRKLVIDNIDWDCEVQTLLREGNLGCGKAVSSAITWFFENVEEGIILEDDCYPSISFFYFCSNLLEYHRDDEKIFNICGTTFYSTKENKNQDYYFTSYTHIWGWATWKNRWAKYSYDMIGYPLEIENIVRRKKLDREQEYYLRYIFDSVYNKSYKSTWDYQFIFSFLKSDALCIKPYKNLITNIGFGEDATHTKSGVSLESHEIGHNLSLVKDIISDENANNYDWDMIRSKGNFFRTQNTMKHKLKTLLNKVFFEKFKEYVLEIKSCYT
ncbi:hypothetical protein [Flammeovirga sp. OC4]|uniref:hypothetical protein n=1 Tax=Flammeovirga sp. OC4 TaxID=1382345 RepID=UPI0005C6B968|nr:hypothetical protein [Flammeovirga sp. OC4]